MFIPLAALCTTNVRFFESSVGIDSSRVYCRCHDSYPYCPSALRSLFALKIKVRTECAARQTRNFRCISLELYPSFWFFTIPHKEVGFQWMTTIN